MFEDWKVKIYFWEKKLWKEFGVEMEGDDILQVCWCVINLCEMKKCERMVMKFKYEVSLEMNWSCVMVLCKELCMEEI